MKKIGSETVMTWSNSPGQISEFWELGPHLLVDIKHFNLGWEGGFLSTIRRPSCCLIDAFMIAILNPYLLKPVELSFVVPFLNLVALVIGFLTLG